MNRIRVKILVNGVVQGVGFRPFLHRLMAGLNICGWICNTSGGVEIEAEADAAAIETFTSELKAAAPALARVDSVRTESCEGLKHYRGIEIRRSRSTEKRATLISPDAAVCADCLREMKNPADRRFGYPFINCTNCGPRFTIVRDVPYDRCSTSMHSFAMCPDCAAEYGDIADRRYHAQPDCCAKCGPELFFLDAQGERVPGDPIELAAQLIRRGGIAAVKGLGAIHLACRGDDPEAVRRLRMRKHRDEKPLALMCRDMAAVRRLCRVSAEEEAALCGHARPIVLLEKHNPAPDCLSENRWLGVMLPYTPVHHLLLEKSPECLVMTSANLSDLPAVIDNRAALEQLRGIADGFLLNNRDIVNRCDDSLQWIADGRVYPVRRSRGYAPAPLEMHGISGGTLACGAEQKASFCLSRGTDVFLSAHIGDLKNAETLEHYESQAALFGRLFDIEPVRIACDLHPDYLSSGYARARARRDGIALVGIQHHHAHMASCMADNGLDGECIGVIWDGTGFGADGTSWGGEFLTGGYKSFRRAGALRGMRLPGGDRAVKEIWRIGATLLLDAGADPGAFFPDVDVQRIAGMLKAGLNCPESSSTGRLFDGVCALLGIRREVSYEGQGAVLLEAAAVRDCEEAYPAEILPEGDMYRFDYRSMVAALSRDLQAGADAGVLAARFMNTMVAMAREMCARIRHDTGLGRVVLSGGVFQNMYMLSRLSAGLAQDGFEVFRHSRVSTNDEGISFGQLAVAERGGGVHVPCSTAQDNRN